MTSDELALLRKASAQAIRRAGCIRRTPDELLGYAWEKSRDVAPHLRYIAAYRGAMFALNEDARGFSSRKSHDARRKRARRGEEVTWPAVVSLPPTMQAPHTPAAAVDARLDLEAAVAKLRSSKARAMLLFAIREGLNGKEAAARVGLTADAFYKTVKRLQQ